MLFYEAHYGGFWHDINDFNMIYGGKTFLKSYRKEIKHKYLHKIYIYTQMMLADSSADT